jgi:hypothetical protein
MRPIALLFTAVLVLTSGVAEAQVPHWMSYQGVLRDAAGVPVPDGVYSVTFAIYDVDTGGTPLWSETQTVATSDGVFNALPGALVPMSGIFFETPCWLGVSIDGEPELSPRTPFSNVPYATHATYAEISLTGDNDWAVDGSNVYVDVGNVGIGTPTPAVRLDVIGGDALCARFENYSDDAGFTVQAFNSVGTAGAFFSGGAPVSWPGDPAAVYGAGDGWSQGGYFSSFYNYGLRASTYSGVGIRASSTTNYSGYFDGGGLGVYVEGQVEAGGFKMPAGAASGYVLTSDGDGLGTWQPAAGGGDGDWTISGSDMYSGVSGSVGIGETAPSAKLEVYTDAAQKALDVQQADYYQAAASIERTTFAGIGSDVLVLKLPAYSDECDFLELQRGSTMEFAIDAGGDIRSNGGAGFGNTVFASRFSTSGDVYSVGSQVTQGEFESTSTDSDVRVLSAVASGADPVDQIAIYAEAEQNDYYGYGVVGIAGYTGVNGVVTATGSDSYRGVAGEAYNGTGTNMGVWGVAGSGAVNWGVYGSTTGSIGTRYAGYFSGDVNITGTLYGGAPACRIDHPLDPANRYLVHPTVQSDEMANMYTGNVVLDARGEAWVEMPDWFEAVNEDVRYQLTSVGAPGPGLYVAREISGGRFMIAGGEPGSKVSWMVTGIRRDPAAVANRVAVEVDKPAGEAGKYMHPEAYGMPATAGVGYIEDK